MLMIPMHEEGFDAVRRGIDKEIYLDITPYWIRRISTVLGLEAAVEKCLRTAGRFNIRSLRFKGLKLRTGNNKSDKILTFDGYVQIRKGRPEWGAEEGKEYIVIVVEKKTGMTYRMLG